MAKTTLHCSFCGKNRDEVKILIAGQEGHICESCVDHAKEIVFQEVESKKDSKSAFKLSVKKPIELKNHLDEYVIGQDEAKKILAVADSTQSLGIHWLDKQGTILMKVWKIFQQAFHPTWSEKANQIKIMDRNFGFYITADGAVHEWCYVFTIVRPQPVHNFVVLLIFRTWIHKFFIFLVPVDDIKQTFVGSISTVKYFALSVENELLKIECHCFTDAEIFGIL